MWQWANRFLVLILVIEMRLERRHLQKLVVIVKIDLVVVAMGECAAPARETVSLEFQLSSWSKVI